VGADHVFQPAGVQGLLRAGGDHHLGRGGGQAEAFGQMAGDGRTQGRQPVREVAGGPGQGVALGPVQEGFRVGQRGGHLRRAVHRGQAQIGLDRGFGEQAGEKAVRPVHGGRGGAMRDDAGARTLAAFGHPLVTQHLVGGGHCVPAHRQGGGQIAFGGQPEPGRQFTGVGQAGNPGREQPVQRAVRGGPVTEQVGQGQGTDAGRRPSGLGHSCSDPARARSAGIGSGPRAWTAT
jgi:hypothetical protein